MESLNDHCVVCGQVIDLGTVSISLHYRRAHPHCSSDRYSANLGRPKIKLVEKKTK